MADRTDDITDLRARVEALEIWRATTATATTHASGPLMTALCSALVNCDPNADLDDWAAEAAAGMAHTIADWLDQQELHVAATRLRMEVG